MEKSRTPLKTITISEVAYLHDEGTTNEHEHPAFLVSVVDHQHNDATEEPFETLAQAGQYAAEVATRPLHPFDVAHILDER